jgi:hypothetical protein
MLRLIETSAYIFERFHPVDLVRVRAVGSRKVLENDAADSLSCAVRES